MIRHLALLHANSRHRLNTSYVCPESSAVPPPVTAVPQIPIHSAIRGDKFCLPHYETPARKDMAVVLAYYNWGNHYRIHQNLLLVINTLACAGIPYFVAEVSAAAFALPPGPNIFQFHSDSYLFYKENLINMAIQRIPVTYTKLCLLDADILFEDAGWYTIVSDCLETADVCKPFHTAKWLNASFCEVIGRRCDSGHPGFAWAMRREWVQPKGLFDLCILGSGDMLLKGSLTTEECVLGDTLSYLRDSYASFLKDRTLPNTIAVAPLTIGHLFHGSYSKRQYHTRDMILTDILTKYGLLSVESVLHRREDGLLEWTPAYKAELNAAFLGFFLQREDDSV